MTHDDSASGNGPTNPRDQAPYCYNKVLDDEIRSRLDKLNSLSDLINSLERQFDEANCLFRETLKHSTDKLSSLAKTLGKKSIKYGRLYREIRYSVEQSQSQCQVACIEFEKANKEHQIAKKAIQDAELKLREVNKATEDDNGVISNQIQNLSFDKLKLIEDIDLDQSLPDSDLTVNDAAKLNDELNQAILRLFEAEKRRCQSQKHHLDKANKLMFDQENLLKLERDHGSSIRRSQLYFDEAKQFDAKLNSVKSEILRINENILAAKQAYAQTLSELEQFSEDLHDISQKITQAD